EVVERVQHQFDVPLPDLAERRNALLRVVGQLLVDPAAGGDLAVVHQALEHVVIDLHVPPLGGLDELEQREEAATNHNGERGGSAQTFEHAPQVPLNDMLAGSVQPEQVGGKDGEREDDQG